jgi:muramoyltetrapeptide carboxypeptidase LdcA involved in peptidoglycan recycling
MNNYKVKYLKLALFEGGEIELEPSKEYNDIGLDWNDPKNLAKQRIYEPNEGWIWDGDRNAEAITWGGCLESIDELLRHGISIPSLEQFENIALLTETSEEIPQAQYVYRVYRALGERGILERVQAILVGRPKAWEFDKQNSPEQKEEYRKQQRQAILKVVRNYNRSVPVIQNLDFGHTDPQIAMPYGIGVKVDGGKKRIMIPF